MTEQIYVGEDLYDRLDQERAEGQSFAGFITQLLNEVDKNV